MPRHQQSASAVDFGPIQLARHLGLAAWQLERARTLDLVPAPDLPGGRWSATIADAASVRVEEIRTVVGREHPIGAHRGADRLAALAGLDVTAADVELLADREALAPVDNYLGHDLYSTADLDRIAADRPDLLAEVIGERLAWVAASLDRFAAAAELGWRVREFDRVAADRALPVGRWGRYARADVQMLRAAGDLMDRVAADRQLGPDQAATRLGIRRTDWEYVTAAGWIAPHTTCWMPVGHRRQVQVPLYRAADVDALLDIPDVDWELVRSCRPGDPSPLRDLTGPRPPSRGRIIRRWLAQAADRWDVEFWAVYRGSTGQWEIDWEIPDGHPTEEQVADMIAADPVVAQYRPDLVLSTESGAATRWARRMLAPGAAVILDTETTDLDEAVVIEVAVIDAATGATLLDTLVHPGGARISDGAFGVHGIPDAALADAPSWDKVLPALRRVTRGRTVLAYNADFDRAAILWSCRRLGLGPRHLADPANWGCVMNRRSDWLRSDSWLRLGGGHRALADCHAARDVLIEIAHPAGTPA